MKQLLVAAIVLASIAAQTSGQSESQLLTCNFKNKLQCAYTANNGVEWTSSSFRSRKGIQGEVMSPPFMNSNKCFTIEWTVNSDLDANGFRIQLERGTSGIGNYTFIAAPNTQNGDTRKAGSKWNKDYVNLK